MSNDTADWQARKTSWSEQNQYLLENALWTDCVFVVKKDDSEKSRFRCHKLLLSKASAVFAAMLHGALAEEDEINVTDINAQIFGLLIQFLYRDELPSNLDVEEASGLCYAANKYMIPRLTSACVSRLESKLSPENVCQAYELAKLMDYRDLEDKCFKMIQERTKEVLKIPSFEDIQHSTLLEIVRQDTLMLYSESRLIKASFRWAEKELTRKGKTINGQNLRNILGPVLSRLRFLALTTKEFADGPATSDILTPEEKVIIFMKISSPCCNVKLPDIFCNINRDRNRPSISLPGFSFGPERHTVVPSDNCRGLQCIISFSVNTGVLLLGVEVPTQDRPEYLGTTYWESCDVILQDGNYALLAVGNYRQSATYNSMTDIKFSKPVALQADTKYRVSLVFLCQQGFYRKGVSVSKATNQNIFVNESKVAVSTTPSYIRSLIYMKM